MTFDKRCTDWWRNPLCWAAAALLAIYATGLGLHMNAFGGGPDMSGYMNDARLISQGKLRVDQMAVPGLDAGKFSPWAFVPLSFKPVGSGKMMDCYALGMPLAVFATAQLTGWNAAPHVIMLVFSLLGIVVTVWLGREAGLPRHWAWFAGLILAASPLYIHMSLMLMSDVPALVCVTCAVTLAWKSRERDTWALLCGIMVAYSVFTRPANAIAMVPVAVCLGFGWRRWIYLVAAGAPGAVAWCLCNHAANGHYLETGYGNMSRYFNLGTIPVTVNYCLHWMPMLLSPWGLFALGLPWQIRRHRIAVVLIVWIVTFFGFYSAYTFTTDGWESSRFLLPAFPACLVGGVMVIRRLLETAPGVWFTTVCARLGWTAAVLWVAPVIFYWAVGVIRLKPHRLVEFQGEYVTVARWADDHIPANAVLLGNNSTGALYCYTSFPMVRENFLRPGNWSDVETACAATHRPLYAAVLYPYDLGALSAEQASRKDWTSNVAEFLQRRLAGKWTRIYQMNGFTIWQLEGTQGETQPPPAAAAGSAQVQ